MRRLRGQEHRHDRGGRDARTSSRTCIGTASYGRDCALLAFAQAPAVCDA